MADSEHVAAQAYLGHLAMQSGRWSEATEHYAAALRMKSGAPVVQSLSGLAHALDGNGVEALALLNAVRNYGGRVPGIHRRHARALLALGKRDEAVEMALRALKADDNDYESKVLLVDLRQE